MRPVLSCCPCRQPGSASRFNPRNAVIVGLIGVEVSSVLFGWADRITILDFSRFLLGDFGALLWAGGISWMISASPISKRGEVMGILLAAAVAGELVGSPIGGLADQIGTEWVFTLMAGVVLVLVLPARAEPAVSEVGGQGLSQAWMAVQNSDA